jgi:hypothetical protein
LLNRSLDEIRDDRVRGIRSACSIALRPARKYGKYQEFIQC